MKTACSAAGVCCGADVAAPNSGEEKETLAEADLGEGVHVDQSETDAPPGRGCGEPGGPSAEDLGEGPAHEGTRCCWGASGEMCREEGRALCTCAATSGAAALPACNSGPRRGSLAVAWRQSGMPRRRSAGRETSDESSRRGSEAAEETAITKELMEPFAELLTEPSKSWSEGLSGQPASQRGAGARQAHQALQTS